MWGTIFNPENHFFQGIDRLFTIMALSLLWLGLCLPLVTAGPATAALYYVLVKCLRRREPYPFKNFLECFKLNFKQGFLAGLICLVVGQGAVLLLYLFYQMAVSGNRTAVVLLVACTVLTMALLGYIAVLFPTLSRFQMGLGGLFLLAGRLASAHILTTLGLGLVLILAGVGVWVLPIGALFFPALAWLLISLPLERIFRAEMLRTMELPPEEERPWYLR